MDDIDAGWGDEIPTVAVKRASKGPRMPEPPGTTPPSRPKSEGDTADRDGSDDAPDRPTTIPEEPPEVFAKRVMHESEDELVFRIDSSRREEVDADFFERPTSPGRVVAHPSQFPTAPPPAAAAPDRAKTVPRPPSLDQLFAIADQAEPPPLEHQSLVERLRRSVTPPTTIELEPVSEPSTPPTNRGGRPSARDPRSHDTIPPRHAEELREMKERFALGDFSGALTLAETILAASPDMGDVRALAEKCREVLLDMYRSRIGDLGQPVSVVLSPDQIRWLSLDHRSGFLLSMVEGCSSVEELLDVSGMPPLDALRLLVGLLEQKVVRVGR